MLFKDVFPPWLVCLIGLLFFSAESIGQFEAKNIPLHLLINAREVIREEIVKVEVKSEQEARLNYRLAVTLLSAESRANLFLVAYDDACKLKRFEVSLYDSDGHFIRQAKKSEFKDIPASAEAGEYLDDRYRLIEVNHKSYPFTLVVEYEQVIKGIRFASFPDWRVLRFTTAVEKAEFLVDVPENFSIHFRTVQLGIRPAVTSIPGRTTYHWVIKDLPATISEPYDPPMHELLPAIFISPGMFEVEGYTGSLDSWEHFSGFIHQLFEDRSTLPEEMAAEVKRMCKGANSPSHKVEILYQYLQKQMRYVSIQLGLGGWQPLSPDFVYDKKFGDCKALTNFMKAMLNEAGIASFPVLIDNGDQLFALSDTFASPLFDHVILYVPETNTWLECTSSSFPPNYIGASNCNRRALLVQEEGGHLIQTPSLSHEDNAESHLIEILLQEEGSAKLTIQQYAKGSAHEPYRYMAKNLPKDEQIKWLQKNSSISTFSIEELSLKSSLNEPLSSMLVKAKVPRYAARAGKRLFVPINGITAFSEVPVPAENRKYDVVIDDPFMECDTFVFLLPQDYTVESLPEESIELACAFGTYRFKLIDADSSRLRFIRHFEIWATRQKPDSYKELRDFLKQVAIVDAQKLVLVKRKT